MKVNPHLTQLAKGTKFEKDTAFLEAMTLALAQDTAEEAVLVLAKAMRDEEVRKWKESKDAN